MLLNEINLNYKNIGRVTNKNEESMASNKILS